MSVFIRGQSVRISSNTDNSGVFIGQNRQDAWDSMSPLKGVAGFSMGDASIVSCWMARYMGYSMVHQLGFDADRKGNESRYWMR